MTKLKIFFIGPEDGTSLQRFNALRRLGHDVRIASPYKSGRGWPKFRAWGFKTGYFGFERSIERQIIVDTDKERFDVVWVDNGDAVGPSLVKALKTRCTFIVNHNLDNPFTDRDGWRWRLFLQALPEYDLVVSPRETSRTAALALGAKRALAVMQSADEVVHRRVVLSDVDKHEYDSDVVFAGTWMPERGPFMLRLLERGVPLRIFGPRWDRAPEYSRLASIVTSRDLGDTEYAKVISGAKIALGLLSSGNEDLHTTRSLEIPAIGTVFCAPRTIDHQRLYVDRQEALFFDSPDECADICLATLANKTSIVSIGQAGHDRALLNGRFNERICSEILAALATSPVQPRRPDGKADRRSTG